MAKAETIESLDFDEHVSQYSKVGQLYRLLYIMRNGSVAVKKKAASRAAELAKEVKCVKVYGDLIEDESLGVDIDAAWLDTHKSALDTRLHSLELERAKISGRDAIRNQHDEHVATLARAGHIPAATKELQKFRESLTDPGQIVYTHMRLARLHVLGNSFADANNHALKVYQMSGKKPYDALNALVLLSLCYMAAGNYFSATNYFIQLNVQSLRNPPAMRVDVFGDLVTIQDIAKYATLASLASYTRQEIKTKILDGPFRDILSEDQTCRDLIECFLDRCDYRETLKTIRTLIPEMSFHPYVSAERVFDSLFVH
eukprot:Platyproteum_vivax@DN3552_c0_g1_i2.p1